MQRWLRIDSEGKPDVYAHLFDASSLLNLNYWLEILFAAGIATLGLVLNSPAVIIGAMLISPLMSPILAAGLALAMGDLYLGIKAIINLIGSTMVSIGLAAFIVWLLPFHSPTSEILSRTNPNLLDLGVAILSGLAGSLVVCRRSKDGGVAALPGVAIAVALMPPLCTIGFGLGSGGNSVIVGGAALLFLTNLVAIVSSAFVVFLLIQMDGTNARFEIDRSRWQRAESDPIYHFIRNTAFARTLAAGGRIHWRVLMLLLLLAAVFVPLRKGLEQVKDEVVTRGAVQEALRDIAPQGAFVSRVVTFGPQEIAISLVSTQIISPAKIQSARRLLMNKTGRAVDINVQEVASRSELRAALERLSTPQPPPSEPPKLSDLGKQAVDLIRPTIQKIWPADIPLVGYELAFSNDGELLRITYEADHDLPPDAVSVFQSVLRAELNSPALSVDLRRQRPSGATPPGKGRRAP